MPQKYSLSTLRAAICWFGLPEMAEISGTSEMTVWMALKKQPIPQEEAVKILRAFSEKAEKAYTLETVDMPILSTKAKEECENSCIDQTHVRHFPSHRTENH